MGFFLRSQQSSLLLFFLAAVSSFTPPRYILQPRQATVLSAAKADKFGVYLLNDNFNMREYVARVLMMVADVSQDDAKTIMMKVNWSGEGALVGAWEEGLAQHTYEGMKKAGLRAAMVKMPSDDDGDDEQQRRQGGSKRGRLSPIPLGSRVEVRRLMAEPDLNWRRGVVVDFWARSGQCEVQLEDPLADGRESVLVHPDHLFVRTWDMKGSTTAPEDHTSIDPWAVDRE